MELEQVSYIYYKLLATISGLLITKDILNYSYKLVITGHSLGTSVATLVAMLLQAVYIVECLITLTLIYINFTRTIHKWSFSGTS